MKTDLKDLSINDYEDAIDEYERIKDEIQELAKNTKYIGIDFLVDELMDEYFRDIDEMQEILNDAENGTMPSAYEDYYENVITPTMRGMK